MRMNLTQRGLLGLEFYHYRRRHSAQTNIAILVAFFKPDTKKTAEDAN